MPFGALKTVAFSYLFTLYFEVLQNVIHERELDSISFVFCVFRAEVVRLNNLTLWVSSIF